MANISQEFRFKTMNYCIEEIKQNALMSKKQKKIWTVLGFSEHLFWLQRLWDVFHSLFLLL